MALLLTDPSNAFALGLLADSRRELRGLGGAQATGNDDDGQAVVLAQKLGRQKLLLFERRAEGQTTARQLGEKNKLLAELLPKLQKLLQRSEVLRKSQEAAATADAQAARALRRSRAVVTVQVEDLQRDIALVQQQAEHLRRRVRDLDDDVRKLRLQEQQQLRDLATLQQHLPSLEAAQRSCCLRLAIAQATLRLAGPNPDALAIHAFRTELLALAVHWAAQAKFMALGRFKDEQAQALMGGRAWLTGELLAGLVAVGEASYARIYFAATCGEHGFLQQIFYVYRAFVLGLYLRQDLTPLIEALRVHRFAQGPRGALSACLWHILRQDQDGFTRLMPQVVAQEAMMWGKSAQPSIGLISLMGSALARLGHEQGLCEPDDLGPTMPRALSRVAAASDLR